MYTCVKYIIFLDLKSCDVARVSNHAFEPLVTGICLSFSTILLLSFTCNVDCTWTVSFSFCYTQMNASEVFLNHAIVIDTVQVLWIRWWVWQTVSRTIAPRSGNCSQWRWYQIQYHQLMHHGFCWKMTHPTLIFLECVIYGKDYLLCPIFLFPKCEIILFVKRSTKCLTLPVTFEWMVTRLSYYTPTVCIPCDDFYQYQNFWPRDFDLFLTNLNLKAKLLNV
jgi:hypothetical protein